MIKLKVISVILSFCMFLVLVTPALAADTQSKDVPSSWAAEKVALAIEAGIVPPHLQGDYQKDITRYEMLELMLQALMSYTGLPLYEMVLYFRSEYIHRNFKDINTDKIHAAYGLGLIKYNENFQDDNLYPDESITRQEAAVILYQTAKLLAKHYYNPVPSFSDEWKANPSSLDAIHYLKATGISNGTGSNCFQPENLATREQAIIMINSIINLKTKNFEELGIESLLYADKKVYIENDYFILVIEKGSIYSKDIEKHILAGLKMAEEVTGLSLYPPEYKDIKILLTSEINQTNNNTHQICLNSRNLIINNENNDVSFAGAACEIILRRNKSIQKPHYYPLTRAYSALVENLVNENNNNLSRTMLSYSLNSSLTLEQFEEFTLYDLQNVIYTENFEKGYSIPISFTYLFLRYVFEKYGMVTVNRFLLEIDNNTTNENSTLDFIIENTSATIKTDLIAWYEKYYGVYIPEIYQSRIVSGNFLHESYPITIENNYKYLPRLFLMPNSIYFIPLCFSATDKPTTIKIGDALKLSEYLGYNPENLLLSQSNSGQLEVRVFDKNGVLIDSHLYAGTTSLSKNGKRADYIEVTGSGLCELTIFYTKSY